MLLIRPTSDDIPIATLQTDIPDYLTSLILHQGQLYWHRREIAQKSVGTPPSALRRATKSSSSALTDGLIGGSS